MYDIFWNMRQDRQIRAVGLEADASTSHAKNARQASISLEARVDKLSLVCQAMWSLIQDSTDLTEQDLAKRVTDLDMLDGRLDGRIGRGVIKCSECGSAICQKFNKCLFCGKAAGDASTFSGV